MQVGQILSRCKDFTELSITPATFLPTSLSECGTFPPFLQMSHCMPMVCRQSIEPNMTLHWFVHPRWFDELGGFTKFENIRLFVDWAKKAFELFGNFFSVETGK